MANSRTGAVNVQVILRCRPLSKEEVSNGTHQVITCNERAREVTVSQNVGGKQLGRSFHFDKVFDPDSSQAKLYRMAIKPIVEEVLEGFNCTIFAYGQTGTGKTYTMEGGPRGSGEGSGEELSEEAGVIPRAIHQIFSILDANDAEYTVKCSFLELYNEETTDLLAVGDAVDQKLKMLEDNGRVVVQGLEEIIVKNKTDIYALLDRGSAKRRTAETLLNKQSSRSHSVFCVTVHMREVSAEGEEVIKTGKLYLVDLAGSENVNRSGAVDARAKEAGLINKSLLTLGRVITALVEKSPHVPYRDSKLTRLLRDSLGGRTKTCVIATIAPTVQCQEETLSTLDYAHRAKNIRNRPEVNQKISKTAHIKELNQEIDRLKAELFCTREKNGVYMPADQFQQREQSSAQLAARVETLEGDLELLREAHKSDMDTAAAELASVQEELRSTFEALQQSRVALEERDFLIATHERSEAALAGHAAGLTSGLRSAATNIEALFNRLDASHGREMANTAVVGQIRDTAVTCLADMQAAFSAAMAAQQQRSSQVVAALDSYLQRKAADLAALQGEMEMLRERLDTIASTAGASVDQVALAGSSALSALHTQHTSYAQTAQEAS
ncbi:Kinesin-like protein KIN-5C [Coccomyxa sp. Obi]|nr:Kinesin-like protein KIN-5C [Coccomyxa sp. Obi]